jgi:hypothetical protein
MSQSKPAFEFSTKNLQVAIFIHASQLLPYLRAERDAAAADKLRFVFADPDRRSSQIQLDYNLGAPVAARNLFASQTFLRQQMSTAIENSKNGESSNGLSARYSHR